MIRSVIITGPTGAIGSALTKSFALSGVDVYAVSRRGSKRLKNIEGLPNTHIVECDISDFASLESTGIKADVLIHLAWEKTTLEGRDNLDTQLKNIEYTLDAVRLAKACGCKAFVGAGSQAEYGVKDCPLDGDNTPVSPESGYGIAKYSAGKFAKNLCSQIGLRFNWCRILSVFGEGDSEGSLISYLIKTIKSGEAPKLTPCGQTWDYLYSEDCAEAIRAVAERGVDKKTYCLGSGSPRTLKEYVTALRDTINPKVDIEFGARDYYPHQPMYLVADIKELSEDTGWTPKTSFEDGIKSIVTSMENNR